MKRLWVLIAVCFVDMIGLMIIAPLLTPYARRFGAPDWMVGWLFSAFAIAQLLASPVWGRVSDRYGRRPALLAGLGGSAVAYVIFGFANSLWLLFVCRIVQGLGGGTTGVAQAYVADTMQPSERAKALGWLSAATSAGVSIGAVIGALARHLGSAAPGVVAAALVLVNMGFAWKWLPESRALHPRRPASGGPPLPPPEPRPIVHALWEVVRHPGRPAAQMIWIYAIGMLALNTVIAVLSLYLIDTFGFTERNLGYVFTIFSVVGVVLRIAPVGWVNAWLGEVQTLRLGALLLVLGLLLMPWPRLFPVFVLCLLLVPAGTAFLFPATSSLVSQRTDRHELGLMMGVQQTFRGIMAIVGPTGATVIYQTLGHGVPFLVAAAIVAGALALSWRVRQGEPVAAGAEAR
ncbi:MAG TPA: MFS transporter [Gemmatimonadales bacterium]|nr:MFS transporter [Gemmatimonadales bacterium]